MVVTRKGSAARGGAGVEGQQDPLTDPLVDGLQPPDTAPETGGEAEEQAPDVEQAEKMGEAIDENLPEEPPVPPEPPPPGPPPGQPAGRLTLDRPPPTPTPPLRSTEELTAGGGTAPRTFTAGWTRREPDQLVDAYMEANWVDTEFGQKVAEFGITPEGLGTEIDHVLPPDTDQGTRKGVNIGVAVGAGILDATVVGLLKSIPGVGIIGHVLTGVRQIWGAVEDAKGIDGDPVPAILTITRALLDIVGSSAGNLSDTCSLITGIAGALGPSTSGGSLAVAGAAETIGRVLDVIGLVADGTKLGLSALNTVYTVVRAEVAEAQGQYGIAGKYRDLAMSNAIFTVIDTLSVIGSLIGVFGTNLIPAEIGENVTESMVKSIGKGGQKQIVKTLLKVLGTIGAKAGATGAGNGLSYDDNDPAGDTAVVSDILATIGLGNSLTTGLGSGIYAMRTEGLDGLVEAPEDDVLEVAWRYTKERMADVRAMSQDDPQWAQSILNTIMEPPGVGALDVFDMLLTPSNLFGGITLLIRKMGLGAGDASSISAGIGAIASGLDVVGQPFFDLINGKIVEWKGNIGEFTAGLADNLAQQKVSMDVMRSGLAGLHGVLDMVDGLADDGTVLTDLISGAMGQLGGLRNLRLNLPWWLRWMEAALLVPVNAAVDAVRSGMAYLVGEVRSSIDARIEEVTGWVRGQIAVVDEALAEGGSVEQVMTMAQAAVVNAVTEFETALKSWDPGAVNLSGAIAWLREMQAAVPAGQSAHERMRGWHAFVATEGQGKVDAWRGKWSDEVTYAFRWQVQDYEMDAVSSIYEETVAGLDHLLGGSDLDTLTAAKLAGQRAGVELAYRTCQGAAGSKVLPMKLQRLAMQSFWTSARLIAAVHRDLRGLSGNTVPPAEGGAPADLTAPGGAGGA